MTEQTLIERLKNKDEEAFRWIVEAYRNKVFNTVVNILHDEDDASDTAQEVFIKVYESIGKFKEESGLGTWIYRIAVNKALDRWRSKKRKQKLFGFFNLSNDESTHPESFFHPGIAFDKKETAAILFKCIDQLPENQKLAFTLIKIQQMKYEEASLIMQKNIKSIESLVSRAKDNLQKLLEQYQ